jgi:bacterioferritin
MAEADKTSRSDITREQMLQLLNEDLVREFQAMVEISKHIDCLNDKSNGLPGSVNTSNVPVEMLCAVLEGERKMAEHYRERLRQADAMGEFELSETLKTIIGQQHEIDFSGVLGSHAPPPNASNNPFDSR